MDVAPRGRHQLPAGQRQMLSLANATIWSLRLRLVEQNSAVNPAHHIQLLGDLRRPIVERRIVAALHDLGQATRWTGGMVLRLHKLVQRVIAKN